MKKFLILLLTVCLLLGTASVFSACSSRPPKVEQIYDRVVELVEASYELNTLFYGEGLPVYEEDSLYAQFSHLYYGFENAGEYEMVTAYAKFMAVEEIKEKAEKVYSTALLESAIYPMCFDGFAAENGSGGALVLHARYYEDEEWLYESTEAETYANKMRIYDYSTMRIIAPSNAKACLVEMQSWYEDSPQKVEPDVLRLVLQEDGNWYLDSVTV